MLRTKAGKRKKTLRINLSREEKNALRDALERKKEELEEKSRELLNELIEVEARMEEMSRDPKAVRELTKEKKKLEKEYAMVTRSLADLELSGLPLEDEVLQDVLSRKIRSVFVPQKEGAEEFLRMELRRLEELEDDVQTLLSHAIDEGDKEVLSKTLEEIQKKRTLIKTVLSRKGGNS